MITVGLLLLGLLAGLFGGMVGLGGGLIVIPALTSFFGFDQKTAQGTTLAFLVPPIGLLATWVYYQKGLVNIPAALLMCLGFVLGSYLSARFAVNQPVGVLQKIFGGVLILVGIKMLFFSSGK